MKTLLAFLLLSLAPQAGKPENPKDGLTLDAVLEKLQSFYEKTGDFSADFAQEVIQKNPKRVFKKSGKVYFRKPGKMRWDYKKPEPVLYVSDGENLFCYQEEEALVYKLSIKDSELFHSLKFLFGSGDFKKDFAAEMLEKRKDGAIPILLKPLAGEKNFKSLTLFVDPVSFLIVETELVDPLNTVNRIRFSSQLFAENPLELFIFKIPSGVRMEDFTK